MQNDKPAPIATKLVNGRVVTVYPYIEPPDSRFVTWSRRRSGTHTHQNVYRGLGDADTGYYDYVQTKADQGE